MARGRPSKKHVIIEAASRLFTQYGYQGTSVDQVVLEAGVSKPTVYSNFPTKLVLWETVLETLIGQAQAQLRELLGTLKAQPNKDFIAGWITIWSAWVAAPERLVAYRILLGEQHKMQDSTFALFDQFEVVLEMVLEGWLKENAISETLFLPLKAISREGMLMPVLLKRSPMEEAAFMSYLRLVVPA